MFRLGRIFALASVLVVAPVTAVASSPSTVPGTWRKLPAAPFAIPGGFGVWTGKQLLVFGRRSVTALDARGNPYIAKSVDAAEAYDPAANTWTRLSPPPGPKYVPGYKAVWTGTRMLAFGAFHSVSYDPKTNAWRALPKPINLGFVAWTGREAIGWGGGCCGDAQADGSAYDPATGAYRKLPRSPLGASQGALGAWTGRELILFLSPYDVDGKPRPASVARAAAYNPATNTWRRIAPLPVSGMRFSGAAGWDGLEVLVVGSGQSAQSAYAYNPATNRWRRLTSLPAPRVGATALWTGKRLFVWGGQNLGASRYLRDGLSYDPRTDRWSEIPKAPLRRGVGGSTIAWTGHSLIIWGGEIGTPAGTNTPPQFPLDGAAFTPTAR